MVEWEVLRHREQCMKAKRIESRSENRWDFCAQRHPALYVWKVTQCDDMFPKEKTQLCFNHPRDPTAGLRSQKGRKIKIF
jgi:hypothetical protein